MIRPDTLLLPVPGDMPHGIDLRNPTRQPPLYDAFTALRNARQRDERDDGSQPADWTLVAELAAGILVGHSKDLEVAAWLTEALVHTDGFAGLAIGAELIAGLVTRYWNELFPAPDPEEPGVGVEQVRLEPLLRLVDENGRLLPAIRLVVLFVLDDGTAFTYTDCQAVKSWTALPTAEQAKRTPPSVGIRPWEAIRTAASTQCAAELHDMRSSIEVALDRWRGLVPLIGTKLGDREFSVQPVVVLLETVLRVVTELAPGTPEPAEVSAGLAPAEAPTASPAARAITDREQALRQLIEISAFFRRTEPFSPVALTLEEAIRRARLDWIDWLAEAVPDRGQREMVLTRLGLRTESGNG